MLNLVLNAHFGTSLVVPKNGLITFLVPVPVQHDLADVLAGLEQCVSLVGLRKSEAVRINQRLELTDIRKLGGVLQYLAVVRASLAGYEGDRHVLRVYGHGLDERIH